jgi:hypothetical protein
MWQQECRCHPWPPLRRAVKCVSECGVENRKAGCWGVVGRMAGSKCVVLGICRNAAKKTRITPGKAKRQTCMRYNSFLPKISKGGDRLDCRSVCDSFEDNSHIGC